jgi:Zn-dependent peptidase ImmA (M78 family)
MAIDRSDMETESNVFAMELLMPSEWLLKDLENNGGIDIEDDIAVKKLADKYRVSVQVMTLRIGQLMKLKI